MPTESNIEIQPNELAQIVESVFGSQSAHYRHLAKALDRTPSHAYEVQTIVGVLTALPSLMFALAAVPGSVLVARLGSYV